MKTKVLLILIPVAMLWSCKTQDNITPTQNKLSVGKSRTLFHGDGLYDVLGYGIDVTKDELDPGSVYLPIIDVSAFATDYTSQLSSYLIQDNTTVGTSNFYSGSTALDYSLSLTQGKGLTVSAGVGNAETIEGAGKAASAPSKTIGGIAGTSDLFTASFSKSTNDVTTNGYSSKYSYASAELTQKVRRWAFSGNTTVAMLMNYLTPAFLNAVNTLSADDLVTLYGTHVLLDISIGGVMKFNYSTSLKNETNTTNQTSDLKIGLGATVAGFAGINIGYTANSAQVTSVKSTSQETLCTLQYYGGTNSGSSISIDPNGNTQTINMGNWTASILPTNASLIGIGNALYIYDFIADPAKKAAVMTAVQNHIDAAQITVVPQQLYEFWSPTVDRHYYSLDPLNSQLYPGSGYGPNGQPFKGFGSPVTTGIVPVYQFYNSGSQDHVLTTNPNPGWSGYIQNGIVFYTSNTNITGTVPVYEFYGNGDHFYSTNRNANAGTSYVYNGQPFYVYPN